MKEIAMGERMEPHTNLRPDRVVWFQGDHFFNSIVGSARDRHLATVHADQFGYPLTTPGIAAAALLTVVAECNGGLPPVQGKIPFMPVHPNVS